MLKEVLRSELKNTLVKLKRDGCISFIPDTIMLEVPKVVSHGDFATNVAMLIAGREGKAPHEVAKLIADSMSRSNMIADIKVAGPGFVNFILKSSVYVDCLKTVIDAGERFGFSNIGKGKKIQVEFVSANPTGPLHIGHGRGAVYGDALASVLTAVGYNVVREYYVNDTGNQIEVLGKSVYLRCKQQMGEEIDFPEECYQGSYITELASQLMKNEESNIILRKEESEAVSLCGKWAAQKILAEIKDDLKSLGVVHDTYFYESKLYEDNLISEVMEKLRQSGLIYHKDGALWFKATQFGDDKDRVVRKKDGTLTYFAADIAYHHRKFKSFDRVIDVWGADHAGYVARIKAVVRALGRSKDDIEVALVQLVNLVKGGKIISMSTRRAAYETLKDVLDVVGRDACRYFFLMRSHNAQLDFDIELAKRHTTDNPVYYIQYAHARICSVFSKAAERGIAFDPSAVNPKLLVLPEEIELAKLLLEYPDVVATSASTLEPHKVAFYLLSLARKFQYYYTRGKDNPSYRVLSSNTELTQARLYLLKNIQIVLRNALKLLGISAPERMQRNE